MCFSGSALKANVCIELRLNVGIQECQRRFCINGVAGVLALKAAGFLFGYIHLY
jgi:hypothetical protein